MYTVFFQIEQIKKQASSQADAFKLMVDERESISKKVSSLETTRQELDEERKKSAELEKEVKALKKQLEDYEFMFADELKKKK